MLITNVQPELTTKRLILRPFTFLDAPLVQQLAGSDAIAATALNIPHPFEDGIAEQWIATHQPDYEAGTAANFAIILHYEQILIGAVGLTINHLQAELGYWIGQAYWGQGYASEASQAIIQFGFEVLSLNRIYATCLKRNVASAKVLQKIGMSYEGTFPQHVYHRGKFEDLDEYSLFK
ncbi:MAG: GNAT family N-acetyltransferase [Calothrix sp. FI2-JRJ7]|jgi:RimJ/RimL family protein N-acetyltransferase|nr:GNAT family N-acetyltransferase [Calothrix sp. FI2-JRJ7]